MTLLKNDLPRWQQCHSSSSRSLSKAEHSARLHHGGGSTAPYSAGAPTAPPPVAANDAGCPPGQLPAIPQTESSAAVGPVVPGHGVAGHAAAASLAADVGPGAAAATASNADACDAATGITRDRALKSHWSPLSNFLIYNFAGSSVPVAIPSRSTDGPDADSTTAAPIKTEFPPQTLRKGPCSQLVSTSKAIMIRIKCCGDSRNKS